MVTPLGQGPRVPGHISKTAGTPGWPRPCSGDARVLHKTEKYHLLGSRLAVTAPQSPVEMAAALCRVPCLTQSLAGAQKLRCPGQGRSHLPKVPLDPWF